MIKKKKKEWREVTAVRERDTLTVENEIDKDSFKRTERKRDRERKKYSRGVEYPK